MRTISGLDIHKDSIFMCIVDEQGKKIEKKFGVSTRQIKELSATMKSHYVSEVCMESTGIYWKPVWHLLEDDFRMCLVNPQFIKQLPGRKSDVRDAEWIATVLLKGPVRNSFVPEGMIRQLRLYGRRINELNKDIIRCEQRIDMILQSCNIRVSNYVSNVDSKSYRKVVVGLIAGERSPDKLVKLVHGRTLNKHGRDTVRDSLEGNIQQADVDLLEQYMNALDMHQVQKGQCLAEMVKLCKKHYNKAFSLLQSIPGIKEQSAAIIISEIGTDMNLFTTAATLVSWAGLRPRNDESAGKIKSRRITHGNKYLRKALMEAAWGASRTQGSIFYNKFWRLRQRNKIQQKCTVAIARHLLMIIWSLLSKEEYFDNKYTRKIRA